MITKRNEEKDSRIKFLAQAAIGITAGAFLLKDSGATKFLSKKIGDVLETSSAISKDISRLSFKEMDAYNIRRIAKKRILDIDSTYKVVSNSSQIKNLDQSKGLFAAIRNYESLKNKSSYINDKFRDNIQAGILMKELKANFNESKDFFEQAQVLVRDVLDKQLQFFEKDENGISKAIKSEFEEHANKGVFEGKGEKIAQVLEDAINNSANILDKIDNEYNSVLHPQLVKAYKEEIFEKFSKSDDFFKDTLDRAAKVSDYIKGYEDNIIEHTKTNSDMYELLSKYVTEDEKFGDLFIDKNLLRVNKNNELYSLQPINKIKETVIEEVSDTLFGKLFGIRSSIINKNAPDFFYIGQGTFDPLLSSLEGNKSNIVEHDYFKIGNKFYSYKNKILSPVKGAEDFYLIGGKHGPQATLFNTIAGNTYYNPVKNKIAERLDIGTKGINSVKEKISILNKLKADSNWYPKVVKRLTDETYDKALGDEKLLSGFYKDLRIVNKMYNDQTFAPSLRFMDALKSKVSSSTARKLLETTSEDNIAEAIINSSSLSQAKFKNKDLETLLKKYKNNIQEINNSMHIGEMKGFKKGKNILKYNDLLKREIAKEVILRNSLGKQNRLSGYAITKSIIEDLNINGAEKKNAKNLLNWAVFQNEGNLFNSSFHLQGNKDFKEEQFKKINSLLKTKRKNDQEQAFLKSFQDGLKTFAKENSSVLETNVEHNPNVLRPYQNNNYMTMRKSIKVSDLLKSLNDDIKFKSKSKKFFKQLYAGRDNLDDLTAFTLIPFHIINRLTTPLEGLGLGFSKANTKSILDLSKNIGLKRILPVAAGITALSYLNYESKNLTGTSLNEAKENAKANFLLGIKTLEDGLGLEHRNKRARMYNPIAAYWAGDYQDKDEYLEYLEYGYDPIRKGRFWDFGSTSEFRGGKVSYWKPNNLRLAHSNYYDESVYGGSDEKWKHSWIPTPRHPLSPIRALLNPYWLEDMHYEDRPYPVSGNLFTDGTPWGAVLNSTIGNVIKPKRKMHQRELGDTLTDVRTLIAERNQQIKDKSTERNIGKLNSSGFTPISFNPNSMPSLSEAVFNIKIDNGKVTSAGFQGQQYAETLGTMNDGQLTVVDSDNVVSDNKIRLGSYKTTNDNKNISNASILVSGLSSIVNLGVSSNAINSNVATKMIAQVNKSIFTKSEIKRQGATNEVGNYHIQPSKRYSEKLNTEYLENMINGTNKSEFVHDLLYSGSELSGMYGFLSETIFPRNKGYKLEQANLNSFSDRFWDASVGGIGGDFMEIARRFFPHEDHNIEQINPIRNTMPDWLPVRFQTGDPYKKIPLGDARLPGRGYESLNKLHSDQYGRYGAFDRYKILGDISPLSEEYKIWRKIARAEIKDPFLIKQMDQIDRRVEDQTKEHDFYDYKFIGKKLTSQEAVIEEVSNTGKFKIIGSEQQYTLAGIDPLNNEEGQSYIHQYLQPGMKVTLKYEDNEYKNRDSEGNISTLVWFNGDSISKRMFEEKTGKEKKDKETLADNYFALSESDMTMGHVYEAIGHMPIPYIHNKFLRIDSPMEAYKNEQIYGTSYATWDHPIKGFIKPAFQKAWGQSLGMQALGLSTFLLSNYASNSSWSETKKLFAHSAFAMTNPGGFAGGVLGFIPKMSFSTHESKVMNVRTLSNVGAVVGFTGYSLANLENPVLSVFNFAAIGTAAAKQLDFKKIGYKIGEKEGALIGAAVGLGLSALKNPQFSLNKLTEKYIPKDTKEKWEIEEYYDRLEYLKYTNLYKKAARLAKRKEGIDVEKIINAFEYNREKSVDEIRKLEEKKLKIQKNILDEKTRTDMISAIDAQIYSLKNPEEYFQMGEYTKSALAYKKAADTTIYGLNEYASITDVLRALPKYDRDFFLEFAKEKDVSKRKDILKYISPYKQKALKVLWHEDLDNNEVDSNNKYFQQHELPNIFWAGWKPQIDLENVKMKTIENEGMLLSDFGLYESQTETPAYITAPEINNIHHSDSTLSMQKDLIALLNGVGLQNVEVSVEQSFNSGIEIVSNIARVESYKLQEKISSILGNIF